MRIEEITRQKLEKSNDKELTWLRVRFMQIWNKHFQGNIKKSANGLDRKDIIIKYGWLLAVMKNRSLEHSTEDIDRQYFKRAMEVAKVGFDISQFQDISFSPHCIFIKNDFMEGDEIEVIIMTEESNKDEHLEKCIQNMFEEQTDKPLVFIYKQDVEGKYLPLFNSVLQPVEKLEEVEIKHSEVDSQEDRKFEKEVQFVPVEKGDEQIVYGIVYQPDVKDSQGDMASAEEIQKAAYQFMEDVQVFKVNHKGRQVKVKVLENYLAPVDFKINKKEIKKGSWVLVTRVLDKKLWQDIKDGKITGYSMAGYAKVS